jgi:tetratricopeptide (TPR) repeat protein
MREGAPSLPVLRGLGLSLARLGQYDPAFKHLRIAHEMEDPKERATAGYLALCGARGTPSRPEDRVKNIAWAIRLVNRFTAPGDAEWAGLVSAIFAEARACQVDVDADDQVYLCEHLVSVNATDPLAAEAFHHLMATHPDAVHSEYAWLFCRASEVHGIGGGHAPALFARTFAEEPRARAFFEQRQWDFSGLELTYLERAAAADPGRFPSALGTDYAERGERLLLERSREQEQSGEIAKALATAQVYLKLAPGNPQAHDRLAYLYYRQGERRQAADLLSGWHRLEPQNPQPLIRLAIIAQQIGDSDRSMESISQALGLTEGRLHADIAFLGARLLLRPEEPATNGNGADHVPSGGDSHARTVALGLLEECLRYDPQHAQALWLLAAVRHLQGEEHVLAEQAPRMDRPQIEDARFHFLAGVCQLASRNYEGVLEACRRAASTSDILHVPANGAAAEAAGEAKLRPADTNKLSLAVESAYLAGWAQQLTGERMAAVEALQEAAAVADSPSAAHAQALLGKIYFEMEDYDEAVSCWQALEPKKRAAWKLNETLAGAVFLSALEAFQDGSYARAADRLREAGRCGLRDRRLGPLLSLCLVKAGQQALFAAKDG